MNAVRAAENNPACRQRISMIEFVGLVDKTETDKYEDTVHIVLQSLNS